MGNTSSSLPLRFPPFPLLARLLRISRQALKYAHPGHVVQGASQGGCFFFFFFLLVRSHVGWRHVAVVSPHTVHTAILRRLWPETVRSPFVRCLPPLKTNKTKKSKNARKTLDDTPLNMGPPGDRTRHTSTERTEDFRWIVDLSWHGM